MWMVLLYTTPLSVGVVLVLLAGAAVVAALWRRRAPRAFAREARWALGAACALSLLVLAAPVLSWDQVGTGDREVVWDPLIAYTEQTAAPPEGVYAVGERPGEVLYYGARELSPEQVEQARREADPADAAFYRHPTVGGGAVWFDSRGRDPEPAVLADLRSRLPPPVDDGATESAALIVQEKVVNALLFVPVGITAFAAFAPWWARLGTGPALSVLIEAVQWAMAAGRSSETGDVLANSTGHLAGVALAAAAALAVGHTPGGHRHRPEVVPPELRHRDG